MDSYSLFVMSPYSKTWRECQDVKEPEVESLVPVVIFSIIFCAVMYLLARYQYAM